MPQSHSGDRDTARSQYQANTRQPHCVRGLRRCRAWQPSRPVCSSGARQIRSMLRTRANTIAAVLSCSRPLRTPASWPLCVHLASLSHSPYTPINPHQHRHLPCTSMRLPQSLPLTPPFLLPLPVPPFSALPPLGQEVGPAERQALRRQAQVRVRGGSQGGHAARARAQDYQGESRTGVWVEAGVGWGWGYENQTDN